MTNRRGGYENKGQDKGYSSVHSDTGCHGRISARFIPERAFEEMRAGTPEPYRSLVTKENISMLLGECLEVIKENKGLEVIHVETADGTFVSIKL